MISATCSKIWLRAYKDGHCISQSTLLFTEGKREGEVNGWQAKSESIGTHYRERERER